MTTLDVLHLSVVLGIVSYVDGRFIVNVKVDGLGVTQAEFAHKSLEVNGLGRSLGGGDYLSLAGGQGNTLLLLGAPRYGGLVEHENVARS